MMNANLGQLRANVFTRYCNRECHAAAKQLQSSLTCRDVVKKNVVIQAVKVIPSSNLHPRWWTMEVGWIPQNESEAVEYLQKRCFFALSDVSFLKLSYFKSYISLVEVNTKTFHFGG